MKKNKDETEMMNVIIGMQQQLVVLEKKLDILINKPAPRPVEIHQSQKPFQRFDQHQRHGQSQHHGQNQHHAMHKAICADCNKECEVPFKPTGDRPVYCKECFSKRKTGGQFKPKHEERPRQEAVSGPVHAEKKPPAEKSKPAKKKRPAAKRKK